MTRVLDIYGSAQNWRSQVRTAINRQGGGVLAATDYGIIADNATDNTTALQAWLDLLGETVRTTDGLNPVWGLLPAGTIRFSSVTISRPVALIGMGVQVTELRQIASEANPAINVRVAHTGNNYYNDFDIPATVTLRGMRIRGGDQASGDTGQHGLDLQDASSNPITTRVVLDDVIVCRFAANGINAASFTGWLDGSRVYAQDNNVHGLSANSCNDFHFVNSSFAGNHGSGALLSGATQFAFSQCNFFSNLLNGVHLFASSGIANHSFSECQVDRNFEHGVNFDMRATTLIVNWTGSTFIYNGQSANDTYDEVRFASGATGRMTFNGCTWGRAFSQQVTSIEKSKFHVGYAGSGGDGVIDANCSFVAGGPPLESTRKSHTLYTDTGALKYRSPAGTISTPGAA